MKPARIGWFLFLLGLGGQLYAQVVFEDGDFTGWATAAVFPTDGLVSGVRQPSGGNPAAHYLVTHTHRPTDSAGFGVSSDSLFEGQSFDLPPVQAGARLEFQIDIRGEDPQPQLLAPELHWRPVLVQNGRKFRSQDIVSGPLPAGFHTDTMAVAREKFRAADGGEPLYPNFSTTAPPMQFGMQVQSIAVVNANLYPSRTIRVRIDNFRVRVLPPPAPGPDLWVTKTDGTDYFCDEDDPSECSVFPFQYTIRYGNRGARLASGVTLTDSLPKSLSGCFPGITCDDWQCTSRPFQGQTCKRAVRSLAPGESRELEFSVFVANPNEILEQGAHNSIAIADDGRNGPDQVPADNRGGDATGALACTDPFSGVFCCTIEWLFGFQRRGGAGSIGESTHQAAAENGVVAVLGTPRNLWRRLGSLAAGILETADDLRLFYRVREDVFQKTSGGRRAIDLYYAHTGEISRLLAQDGELRDQALSTLSLWKPNLEALVAGNGAALVSQAQVAAIQDFLGGLKAAASPALREVIEREAEAIGLNSCAGLTLNQGLARLNRFTCEPDETNLCLGGGRFRVEAEWRTPQGRTGRARAVPLTSDTGYFWFFGASNIEALVKLLDACNAGSHFWFFAAGLTNVEVDLAVTDTWTGQVRTYKNPLGKPFQPLQDTSAFKTCAAPAPAGAPLELQSPVPPGSAVGASSFAAPAHACVPGPEALCLQGGRFRVETEWRTPQGQSGRGKAVPLTADTGYFRFFRPDNVEEIVKVHNGCGLNQRYWVFGAGLTNVRVVTRVTDTHTGQVRTYTNPQGQPFQPLQDTGAFATCP